jgi:nitric oxide reductase large subunit
VNVEKFNPNEFPSAERLTNLSVYKFWTSAEVNESIMYTSSYRNSPSVNNKNSHTPHKAEFKSMEKCSEISPLLGMNMEIYIYYYYLILNVLERVGRLAEFFVLDLIPFFLRIMFQELLKQ